MRFSFSKFPYRPQLSRNQKKKEKQKKNKKKNIPPASSFSADRVTRSFDDDFVSEKNKQTKNKRETPTGNVDERDAHTGAHETKQKTKGKRISIPKAETERATAVGCLP